MNELKKLEEEVELFIKMIYNDYYLWYEKTERRYRLAWNILQMIVIISGFLSSILIAALGEDPSQTWRIVIIVLPSVGSLCSTILIQFRLYDVWKAREEGRYAFDNLIYAGKINTLKAKTIEDLHNILEFLRGEIHKIEKSQSLKIFSALEQTKGDD